MKTRLAMACMSLLLVTAACGWKNDGVVLAGDPAANTLYGFSLPDLEGKTRSLGEWRGQVLLLVNTASRCGLTPQYRDLQALHVRLAPRGFSVLGFPSSDFLGQEPGTAGEIREFCTKNYGVTFPLFAKLSVKGDTIHPLFRWLSTRDGNGALDAPVAWNFHKFVVDRRGRLVAAFGPARLATDPRLTELLDRLLAEK